MRSAFVRAVTAAAATDDRILILTADLGYKLFDEFSARFPGRFRNMGVCEANMVSVAAGLALEGKRPFVYSIVPFATIRCLEQIRNDLCNMNLPVVVVGVGAGYSYGVNGPTHHGIEDMAALRALAGMTVLCPADPRETEQAVRALLELEKPSYLRLGRAGETVLHNTDAAFEIGRPKILLEGREVALLACGSVVSQALLAAQALKPRGVCPLVASIHTVKPILSLRQMLAERQISHVVTVEEHGPCGGLYEAICSRLNADRYFVPVIGLCAPDRVTHDSGSQEFLRKAAGLDAESIVTTICRIRGEDR